MAVRPWRLITLVQGASLRVPAPTASKMPSSMVAEETMELFLSIVTIRPPMSFRLREPAHGPVAAIPRPAVMAAETARYFVILTVLSPPGSFYPMYRDQGGILPAGGVSIVGIRAQLPGNWIRTALVRYSASEHLPCPAYG